MPYAEIHEPFQSWVDVDAGFSRIDYYDGKIVYWFTLTLNTEIIGAAKTLQRKGRGGQDYGASYKIVPMSGMCIYLENAFRWFRLIRWTSFE